MSKEMRQMTEGNGFMKRLLLCLGVVLILASFGGAKLIAGAGPPPPPPTPPPTNSVSVAQGLPAQ